MDDSVDVLQIDPHSQCNSSTHNPYNSIRRRKIAQDDILVVLRCTGMEHSNHTLTAPGGGHLVKMGIFGPPGLPFPGKSSRGISVLEKNSPGGPKTSVLQTIMNFGPNVKF